MHLDAARVEPLVDVRAVLLDERLHGRIGHRRAGRHQRGHVAIDRAPVALDLLPLGLAVLLGAAHRLLVGVGVAPALLGLVLVLRGIEVAEQSLHVVGLHDVSFLEGAQGGVEGGEHRVDPRTFFDERFTMLAQELLARACLIDRECDLVERQAELAEQQHLLQPDHVGVVVQAVAGRRALRRHHESDVIVVMQCAHRDACQLG